MKEHPYTELKKEFDHLQGRAIELIREGMRQEGVLKTTAVNALKHCGAIVEMDDIDEMKKRAAWLRDFIEESLRRYDDIENKTEAILLTSQSGDWEGLFINGKLYSEGHRLGEGREEVFWLDVGVTYGVSGADLIVKEVNDRDDDFVADGGNFPEHLSDLSGEYN